MKKFILLMLLSLFSLALYSQIPTPNAANNTFHCLNEVQVYGDQIIDPLATYSFNINPPISFNIISGGDQIEVTWDTPGTYVIEVTKTIGQCFSIGQAIITIYPQTSSIITTDALCQGNGTIILNANPLGTNPLFSGVGVTGNIFDANGLLPGVYQISFSSLDGNGCEINGNGSITITPPPTIPIIFTN
jgi:hypothetical protein